jgi:hypothetical protein
MHCQRLAQRPRGQDHAPTGKQFAQSLDAAADPFARGFLANT